MLTVLLRWLFRPSEVVQFLRSFLNTRKIIRKEHFSRKHAICMHAIGELEITGGHKLASVYMRTSSPTLSVCGRGERMIGCVCWSYWKGGLIVPYMYRTVQQSNLTYNLHLNSRYVRVRSHKLFVPSAAPKSASRSLCLREMLL